MKPLYILSIALLCASCTGSKIKDRLYNEQYRPQIHFSPASGWMNDPNGMVYYEGAYHLFYQHYPDNTQWGPMHWGHAVSKDLIHWEHLPIAIYPDSAGYIFSGSAVVDTHNTSGLGTSEKPPLLAFFTYHDPVKAAKGEIDVESQAMAYSTDKGRTWIKYAHNPVIENIGIRDFRDPKVIWSAKHNIWIMSVASGQEIRFFTSGNCIDWKSSGTFGENYGAHTGVWECPDLFPLTVNGEEKWVLLVCLGNGPTGSPATQYFVGDFDGNTFTSDQKETLWLDYGSDCYAGVTWSNQPDNRRIFISWMNSWSYAGQEPCETWSGAAGFPRELKLEKEQHIYLLTSAPIKEIEKLYGAKQVLKNIKVEKRLNISDEFTFPKSPVEIKITFDNTKATAINFPEKYGITLSNGSGEHITIGYNNVDQYFYIDRTNAGKVFSEKFQGIHVAPYILNENTVDWQLLIDKSSVELFAAGYKISMTDVFYPTEDFDTINLFAANGIITIKEITINELKSVWEESLIIK